MRCRPSQSSSSPRSRLAAFALLAAGCGGGAGSPGIASVASSGTTAADNDHDDDRGRRERLAVGREAGLGGWRTTVPDRDERRHRGRREVLRLHAQARGDELPRPQRPGTDHVPLGDGHRPGLAGVHVRPDSLRQAAPERRPADPGRRSRRASSSCSPSRRACVRTGSRTSPTRPTVAFTLHAHFRQRPRPEQPAPSRTHSRPAKGTSRSRAALPLHRRPRPGAGEPVTRARVMAGAAVRRIPAPVRFASVPAGAAAGGRSRGPAGRGRSGGGGRRPVHGRFAGRERVRRQRGGYLADDGETRGSVAADAGERDARLRRCLDDRRFRGHGALERPTGAANGVGGQIRP